jgi:ribosomal protein S8
MAYFTPDDLNIDVEEFYYEMSSREKEEMYDLLRADGYYSSFKKEDEKPASVPEWEFINIMSKITSNRLQLTSEEDEMLKKIASRF